MIEILKTFSTSCHFQLQVTKDLRGDFVKLYRESVFQDLGWPVNWKEQYMSLSHPGVLRGLHFQLPPHDHDKLVVVLAGHILDAVVDLRQTSTTFGQHELFSVQKGQGVFVPRGFAHGFFVDSHQEALLLYLTTSEYQPSHDTGLLWNTLGIDWPTRDVIISERDQSFGAFSDFVTPF